MVKFLSVQIEGQQFLQFETQMWLVDCFHAGFKFTGPATGLEVFSFLYALSALVKFSTETRRGYFDAFKRGTYLHFYHVMRKPFLVIPEFLYKSVYLAKIVASVFLLCSLYPKVCLIILSISFFMEAKIYFKYHTVFFMLMGLMLLSAPLQLSPGAIFSLAWGLDPFSHQDVDLYPQLFGLSIVTAMYWGAGYRKLNKSFLSGDVVLEQIRFAIEEKSKRYFYDSYYPQILQKSVIHRSIVLRRTISSFMYATAALELSLPFLLVFDSTRTVGLILGIAMHLGFTFLFPVTLAHFSMLSICSYMLWVDPHTVSSIAMSYLK